MPQSMTMTRRELTTLLRAEAFSSYVRMMRDALGMKQIDLVKLLKEGQYHVSTHPKDLWEIENAKRIPREPLMSALILALDLDPRHVDRAQSYGAEVAHRIMGDAEELELDTEPLIMEARAYAAGMVQERIGDRQRQNALQRIAEGVPEEDIKQVLTTLRELYAKNPERAREYLALGAFFLNT